MAALEAAAGGGSQRVGASHAHAAIDRFVLNQTLLTDPHRPSSPSSSSSNGGSGSLFVLALFHCSLCAFMLGWHVHEKAVLVPALLLALLAPGDPRCGASPAAGHHRHLLTWWTLSSACHTHQTTAHLAFWLSTVGHAALLPLFPPLTADALTAYLLLQAHMLVAWLLTQAAHPHDEAALRWPWHERLYFLGLQFVLVFTLLLHPWLLADRFPFLARLACSIYCGVGLVAVWLRSYQLLWEAGDEEGETVTGGSVFAAASVPSKKKGAKPVAAAAAAAREKKQEAESAKPKTPEKRAAAATGKGKGSKGASKAKAKPEPAAVADDEGPQRRSRRLEGKGKPKGKAK